MAERRLARCGGSAVLPSAPPRRSGTLGDRGEVFTCLSSGQACITRGYRDHSFTSRFHGNNTGAASAVVSRSAGVHPAAIRIASIAMTQSIAGQPAPELAIPYRIDAEGKERPPLTLKELGARHRLLIFYQHWCGGCHSHGFPTLQALVQDPAPRRRDRQSRPLSRAPTSIRATSYPWTSGATASGVPSATKAVRRSASFPPRWKAALKSRCSRFGHP